MIPQALHGLLAAQYGALSAEIERGYAATRKVSFRVNRLRGEGDAAMALQERGIALRPVPWYDDAYLAENAREAALRETPLYTEGKIYLQSLSSMLPPLYLQPQAGECILDMTAAPGGKTTQLCALSGGKALITACERDKIRFERMQFNFARLGAARVTAICKDALLLDEAFSFDKILLDAPCSGSGTFSAARPARFTEEFPARCAALQEKLLKKALKLLKKGGTLVYSICSVLRQENEEVLGRCLDGSCAIEPVAPFDGLPLLPTDIPGTITVCPTEEYEGFFLAKIRKQ